MIPNFQLSGHRILLTRPAGRNKNLRKILEEKGAEVGVFPAIEIQPLTDNDPLDAAIRSVAGSHCWACFFSVNAARFFLDRARFLGFQPSDFNDCQFGCVGKSTEKELLSQNITCDFVPEERSAEGFSKEFCARFNDYEGKIWLFGADRGGAGRFNPLLQRGFKVTLVASYQNIDRPDVPAELVTEMNDGAWDWIVITSSASAANLVRLFGAAINQLKVATISPITAAKLESLGITVSAVAVEPIDLAICQAICLSESNNRQSENR